MYSDFLSAVFKSDLFGLFSIFSVVLSKKLIRRCSALQIHSGCICWTFQMHTSKKQKSLQILLFRPKKSAEKMCKSSHLNVATKVEKSIKFNEKRAYVCQKRFVPMILAHRIICGFSKAANPAFLMFKHSLKSPA